MKKKPDILDNHMLSLSRRRFIAGTGGLTFMISIGGLINGNWVAANEDSQGSRTKGSNINVWVKIDSEGTITILNPSAETVSYTHLTLPTNREV